MTAEAAPSLGDRLIGLLGRIRPRPKEKLRDRILSFVGPRGTGLTQPWQILAGIALAGFVGLFLVTMLGGLSKQQMPKEDLAWSGVIFVLALLLFRQLQRFVLRTTTSSVEDALGRIRQRLIGHVSQLELSGFERLPKNHIVGALSHQFVTISDATLPLLLGLQAAILVPFSLFYIASISTYAAIISIVVIVIGYRIFVMRQEEMEARIRRTAQAEAGMEEILLDLSGGFRELRLNGPKRAAFLEALLARTQAVTHERTAKAGTITDMVIFGSSVAFLMGGSFVFVLPLVSKIDQVHLPRLIAIVLFMIGPLGAVVAAGRHLTAARTAIDGILAFEAELKTLASREKNGETPAAPDFETLEVNGLRYEHSATAPGDPEFTIGPIDLALTRGEIVFLTGENGSGKSTFVRLMCGLYPPSGGSLMVNGTPVRFRDETGEAYRQLFGTVLDGAHVLSRAYALPEARLPAFEDALITMGIRELLPEDLTAEFSPGRLSTGQRKRLALALAIAEDRPILVLDEWAADQDPASRHMFYEKTLPQLKSTGKTIIAITHDDRYFDVADRRFHLNDGQLTRVTANDD